MLTVYHVQPEVKRPGDTLKHHVGDVVALDAPYQNTVQIGLAVRDIFYPLCVVFIHLFASLGRDCLVSLDWFA